MVIEWDTRINLKKKKWDFRLKSTPLQDQKEVLIVILNLQREQRGKILNAFFINRKFSVQIQN